MRGPGSPRILGLVAAAAFVAAAAGSFVLVPMLGRPPAVSHRHASPPPAATASPAAPRPTSMPARPVAPSRLRIPAIGVDAGVEPVGVTREGNMDVPKAVNHVGWYAPGVTPGQPGDAVIDGHLDWYTGPSVFAALHRLRAGDAVEVDMVGGGTVRFHVYQTATYPADRPPPDLFRAGGPPRVTLITCAGRWDGHSYSRRLVVDAR